MLCTCQRCCARFPAVVHVSQKLCTFHKPPNNVRVQMYTHWAHSNQQKHWGDQTHSPDIYIYTHYIMYIYIYIHIIYIYMMYIIWDLGMYKYIYIYTCVSIWLLPLKAREVTPLRQRLGGRRRTSLGWDPTQLRSHLPAAGKLLGGRALEVGCADGMVVRARKGEDSMRKTVLRERFNSGEYVA